MIKPITIDHAARYGAIFAAAFSAPPWKEAWKPEDAAVHVREIIESRQSYGLEYCLDDKVVGFILGASMLFYYGRTFEINDLAVDPAYQRQGIASALVERCIADVKKQGIVGLHLITAGDSFLPAYYERYGFKKENRVILMGREL
jgi:ribosomal protein S18 acetylase RimI-like enzyme